MGRYEEVKEGKSESGDKGECEGESKGKGEVEVKT